MPRPRSTARATASRGWGRRAVRFTAGAVGRLIRVLLLSEGPAPATRAGRWAQRGWVTVTLGAIVVAGTVTHWPAATLERQALQAMTGMLWGSAAVALGLLHRELVLLYGWPVRAERLAQSLIMTRPWAVLLLGALIHLTTALSLETFLLLRDPGTPALLRWLAWGAVQLAALPFWIALTHVRQLRRAARTLRGDDVSGARCARRSRWRSIREAARDAVTPLREIAQGLRRRTAR